MMTVALLMENASASQALGPYQDSAGIAKIVSETSKGRPGKTVQNGTDRGINTY
jgi:hypothetical protein